MNNTCLLFFFSLLLLSCNQTPSLNYTTKSFTEQQLAICESDPCSSIFLEFPVFEGEEAVVKILNNKIERSLVNGLFLGEEPESSAQNIEEAATDFIMAYRDYQADIPSAIDQGGYEADVVMTPYLTEALLSIENQFSLYTGGAHGYGGIFYLNFNPSNGNEVETQDLFSDYPGFVKAAEIAFRKANKIPSEENINATGFWFENEEFHLAQSIGWTHEHIVIVYNPYEIAPYSEGIIELKLPLEDIEAYLNMAFL